MAYYMKSGVLHRRWRPVTAKVDEGVWDVERVVVPVGYRVDLVKLAHESPLAGHLGVTKTTQRLQDNFYWPGIKRDVARFIKCCHLCQVVGRPNHKIPVAPLIPIPAVEPPLYPSLGRYGRAPPFYI